MPIGFCRVVAGGDGDPDLWYGGLDSFWGFVVLRELMLLDDVVAEYRSVYPDFSTWDELLAWMLADPIQRETVEGLAAVLRAGEGFRKPVVLGLAEVWDDEDVVISSYPAVFDGTHRLCAHVLAGVQEVYVEQRLESDQVVGDFPVDESDPRYNWVMCTRLEMPVCRLDQVPLAVAVAAGGDEREVDLLVWEVLMSLRVDDDVWLSSATAGSQRLDGVVSVSVAWDAEAFLTLPDVVTVAVREKLVRYGFDLTDVAVWTELEDYSGDEVRVIADPGSVLPFVPLPRM